jgi:hypothetical protein
MRCSKPQNSSARPFWIESTQKEGIAQPGKREANDIVIERSDKSLLNAPAA